MFNNKIEITLDEYFIQTKFGYCYYCFTPKPFVYNLYVHKQYRRQGHSKKLLQLVINEIREKYNGEIYIQAEPTENSIGLEDLIKYYESMGLTIYDRKE
jgi:GNAT superfamily N-acetyltransferase